MPWLWWCLPLGPFAMYLFFRFASLPLMDRRSLERRPGYDRLLRELPAMAPIPPLTLAPALRSWLHPSSHASSDTDASSCDSMKKRK